MLKLFITTCLVIFSITLLYSGQWTKVDLPVDSKNSMLWSVSFPSPQCGWAVGFDMENRKGLVFSYTDGKWNKIEVPNISKNWTLRACHFFGKEEGWAVGCNNETQKGLILHYLKGQWIVEELIPEVQVDDYMLLGVYFLNVNEGWAVGGSGKQKGAVVLYYQDGKWYSKGSQELLKKHLFRTVTALSADDVWFGGQREGNLWGTTKFDAPWNTYEIHANGTDWVDVEQPIPLKNAWRTDYFFFSANDGWCTGNMSDTWGKIGHWDGLKWEAVDVPDISKNWALNCIYFSTSDYGLAGGVSKNDKPVILEYKNKKWELLNKKQLPDFIEEWYLNDIVCDKANTWWGVGKDMEKNKALILKYLP